MNYSKKVIINSLSIKFVEQISVKFTSLLVSIILARIIEVEAFGIIAILTVFTHLSSAIIEGGLSTSLIQRKNVQSIDYSTIFYTSWIIAIVVYIVLFCGAPIIAEIFDNRELTIYIRIICLVLFVTPFNTIQLGFVYRNMLFKRLMLSSLVACAISGVAGIVLAILGYGIWALIIQTLLNGLVSAIVLFIVIDWKPTFEFSISVLKSHFSYGWMLLVSSIIDTIYTEIQSLLIGERFNSKALAYYNRGDIYPKYIMQSLNTAVQTVMLPVLSSKQDEINEMKVIMRQTMSLSAFLLFPIMAGFAAITDSIVRIVLTAKWLPCVPYMQLACVTYVFQPINSCNLQAIKAIGRSDVFLMVNVIKKIIGFVILFVALFTCKSPIVVSISTALYAPIQLIINAYPNTKLINYSLNEQIIDVMPSLFISVIMFSIVSFIKINNISVFLLLGIQVSVGVVVYILLAYIFKIDAFFKCIHLVKGYVK